MTAILSRAPLRFYQDRLRATLAEEELVGDSDLFAFLADGYARLCERSGCLQALATITLIPGQAEYTLPTDHYRTQMIAAAGAPLDMILLQDSLRNYGSGVPTGWYAYSNKIGMAPTPNTAGTISILYEASPPPPTSLDDTLDPRCLPEYRYGIVHWVRWRLTQLDGGAQGISKANYERALFEEAVSKLRADSRTATLGVGGTRMRSIVEQGRALR